MNLIGSKKKLDCSTDVKCKLIEEQNLEIPISRQCELVGLARSSFYYEPVGESEENLLLMRLIDQQYTRTPFFGVPRMTVWLRAEGYQVNHKRIRRLMQVMGLEAIYPKPRLSQANSGHKLYPYLLKGVAIERPNQVWCTDITYVPMAKGFVYLVAIMDWHSRYVLSWEISNSMDVSFCLSALERALALARPDIFNSDQGSQFTSREFTSRLEAAQVRISMDGRGRVFDNIFIERLWRSIKYEDIYLKEYLDVLSLIAGLEDYLEFYNRQRPHQGLGYRTPEAVYREVA